MDTQAGDETAPGGLTAVDGTERYRYSPAAPPLPENQYTAVLRRFPQYARSGLRAVMAGGQPYMIFGSGDCTENGMRTLGNFAFCSGLLASGAVSGIEENEREEMLRWARSAVKYMCETHVSGASTGVDGRRWGCEWQSAWWAAKMALGARHIWDRLTNDERAAVRRTVAAESDRFVGVPARTGLFRDTKAEENAWDTEVLAVAVAMFPDHPSHAKWETTLREYAMNSLSAPQDLRNATAIDGRPVSEQVYTVNVHSDFSVENHGPYHFCYMASPMHSLTWGYYALASAGGPVSESQLHNVDGLWDRIRSTFLDTRFAHIGGQDWARYTYGLYFILPVLTLLARLRRDRAAHAIELARLGRLAWEQAMNQDGSFFGTRVTHGRMSGQWAKYETDCYANVGLAFLLRRELPDPPAPLDADELNRDLADRHCSPEGGYCYARTPGGLFASFSWECLEGPYPLALFVPPAMDDATEWTRNNLLGVVLVPHGRDQTLAQRRMHCTDDGFSVEGKIMYRDCRGGWLFVHDLQIVFSEREGTMAVENRFTARRDMLVRGACGLRLHVANDIFNGCRRRYHTPSGELDLEFRPRPVGRAVRKFDAAARRLGLSLLETRVPLSGNWVNVDGKMGVVCDTPAGGFSVMRGPSRAAPWQSLYYDKLELGAAGPRRVRGGQVVVHSRYILVAGDRDRTAAVAEQFERYAPAKLRPEAAIV